jgi:hypothetical protein
MFSRPAATLNVASIGTSSPTPSMIAVPTSSMRTVSPTVTLALSPTPVVSPRCRPLASNSLYCTAMTFCALAGASGVSSRTAHAKDTRTPRMIDFIECLPIE